MTVRFRLPTLNQMVIIVEEKEKEELRRYIKELDRIEKLLREKKDAICKEKFEKAFSETVGDIFMFGVIQVNLIGSDTVVCVHDIADTLFKINIMVDNLEIFNYLVNRRYLENIKTININEIVPDYGYHKLHFDEEFQKKIDEIENSEEAKELERLKGIKMFNEDIL